MIARIFICFIFCVLSFISSLYAQDEKVKGITLVASRDSIPNSTFDELTAINANYVVINPYAFSKTETSTEIFYNPDRQWWGETPDGIADGIKKAHNAGFKVILKPHVWIRNGWVGNVEIDSLPLKRQWQESYRSYIMTMVRIAVEQEVEMFCIGTEYDKMVQTDLDFWKELLRDVRRIYSGEITYAANWTDYDQMDIWKYVDYIGIDAYFPLHPAETPSVEQLMAKWDSIKIAIHTVSKKYEKKVLFTEFGYLSVDGGAFEHWKLEPIRHTLSVNEVVQANSFRALLQTFMPEPWFKGVFLWKWYPNETANIGEGYSAKDYTPQGKLGLEVLRDEFGK